jgi:hypothetical protein
MSTCSIHDHGNQSASCVLGDAGDSKEPLTPKVTDIAHSTAEQNAEELKRRRNRLAQRKHRQRMFVEQLSLNDLLICIPKIGKKASMEQRKTEKENSALTKSGLLTKPGSGKKEMEGRHPSQNFGRVQEGYSIELLGECEKE